MWSSLAWRCRLPAEDEIRRGPLLPLWTSCYNLPRHTMCPCFLSLPRSLWNYTFSSSHMLRASDHIASDLAPVDTAVELFVHEPTNCDVVASHEVQTMVHLRAWLRIVCWSDDSFDRVIEDDVGDLIAREEGPDQCSAVNRDH
jgi:hypothetical protein